MASSKRKRGGVERTTDEFMLGDEGDGGRRRSTRIARGKIPASTMEPRKTKTKTERGLKSSAPKPTKTKATTTATPAQDSAATSSDGITTTPFTIPHPTTSTPIPCQHLQLSTPSATPLASSLIFTHGASGTLSAPATALFATGFASLAPLTLFHGSSNLKSRVSAFDAVLENECTRSTEGKGGERPIALGGRSMGARAAVVCATHASQIRPGRVSAVVLASYPLVGGTKGDVRDAILYGLPAEVDVLFVVGGEDAMCPLPLLRKVVKGMGAKIWVVVVKGADHGMGVRGVGKGGVEGLRSEGGRVAAKWIAERDRGRREMEVWWDGEVRSSGWRDEKGG